MNYKVDYREIKTRVEIAALAQILNLDLHVEKDELRGHCPTCRGGNKRELLIRPKRNKYGCYANGNKLGGDIIELTAHILGLTLRQAAEWIDEKFPVPRRAHRPSPIPQAAESEEPTSPDLLQKIAARLEPDHRAVQDLGIDAETARRCGIGYDPSGVNRARVAFPIFEDGQLIGFLGFDPQGDPIVKVPDSLKPQRAPELPANVVPLRPKTATPCTCR